MIKFAENLIKKLKKRRREIAKDWLLDGYEVEREIRISEIDNFIKLIKEIK